MHRDAPRAILFDLDGVLIHSYRVWFHLLNQTARAFGYPAISTETYERSWGQSTTADRDHFFPDHSIEDVERFYQEHYFEHIEHLEVPEEVPGLFPRLRDKGVRTAVVTNTQKSLATLLVQRAGASPDVVVGGGDAPRGKPAPDMLLLACDQLEVEPAESWMVGDSVYDQEAAREAKVFFVGVGIDGDRRVKAVGEVLELEAI
jgi:phosphoglycolate phosphatase